MKQIKIVYELDKPDPRPKKKFHDWELFLRNNDARLRQGRRELKPEEYFEGGKK